ncbi:MAG: MFS transporter [Bryobacterales bacterium]|nr:MFS transporter [Bryobacterales bacterium]
MHQDEHHNGWVFTICYIFIFLAAPVFYVGIVQAALFDKLGASKTLANLPASAYLLGQIAPLFFSWLVPYRLERNMVVWANLATASFSTMVFLTLALPAPAELRIGAVVLQGLLQGLSASTSFVFMQQCLRRGCSEAEVARTLQRTFSITPFAAVAGSLGAQFLLSPGLAAFPYPYDFAIIYLIAIPCALGIAFNARRFRLAEIAEREREPFFAFLMESARGYFRQRRLATTWIAYVLWYIALGVTVNLALYAKEALHRDPADFSGWTMAIRFGGKAIGGFVLGLIAVRYGLRAGALGCIALLILGSGWAWTTPGIVYLFAFALIGAGELGGAYLPNYVGSLSAPSESTRNFAIITLATPFSSFAPVVHGALTDHYGFPASFAFAIITAGVAFVLVALPEKGRMPVALPK